MPKTNDSLKTDRTNIAPIAENGCQQVETAVSNIVQTVAEQQPIGNGVTLHNSKRHTGNCEHCHDSMTIVRTTGAKRKKYCSTRCRVAAYRARQGVEK